MNIRPALFAFLIIMLLLPVAIGQAAIYSYVDQFGRLHFTNVPADPKYREVPGYDDVRKSANKGRYGQIIRKAAEQFGLDSELIRAIIKVESNFNPYAVSEKGAMGLMQLMPETAKEMEVASPFKAWDNIMGGSRYLRKLLNRFDGDLMLGLAAYNAGPRRVIEYGGVPEIPETRHYVNKVLREYGKNRAGSLAGN